MNFFVNFLVFMTVVVFPRETEPYGPGSTLGTAGIFPGTLWCGAGNIAEEKSSLGIFSGSDRFVLRLISLSFFAIDKMGAATTLSLMV
jgi:hypothetical protein